MPFIYPPSGFIFWNPEAEDSSVIFLLRHVHTSHQAHAHQLKAHGHLFPRSHTPAPPVLDWFLMLISSVIKPSGVVKELHASWCGRVGTSAHPPLQALVYTPSLMESLLRDP